MDPHRFLQQKEIGKGNYGTVYKAFDSQSLSYVAIKQVPLNEAGQGFPVSSLREVSLLKECKHPNIVTLHSVTTSKTHLFLIFEYLEQDLYQLLTKGQLPLPTIKSFTQQILQGVKHCHSRRILHRDLKPQNILVQSDGTLKLADFGLSRTYCILSQGKFTQEVVTLWYRAPEILLEAPSYSTPIDIWSVGCICAEMLQKGAILFRGTGTLDQIIQIFKIMGTPDESIWEGWSELGGSDHGWRMQNKRDLGTLLPNADQKLIRLLDQMLCYDPKKRISASMALMDPVFF